MKTSDRMNSVRESGTARMARIAREMEAAGSSILKLGTGEPDFDTPEFVREAACRAIHGGQTRYTDVTGTRHLREAVSEKFRTENSIDCRPEQVIVGTGAKQLIFNAIMATVSQGDEVIFPAPHWVSYPDMVRLADGVPHIVACAAADGYKLTAAMLEEAISDRSRWLILNSPCNPTGAVYSAGELRDLATVLRRHPQLGVISDDIYEKLLFGGAEFATMAEVAPELGDRILTVNGVSKSMAMTGWRIGYATGPQQLISAMAKIQGQSTTNPSSVSQAAALAALTEQDAARQFVSHCRAVYERRRDLVVEGLGRSDRLTMFRPDGAFYGFVDCSAVIGTRIPGGTTMVDDHDVCAWLLEGAGVSVVPGSEFGAPGHFRLSFATSDEILVEACSRIVEAVAEAG